jgi:TetR/AcrR family transcriptional regulator, tetracycline repressor protein
MAARPKAKRRNVERASALTRDRIVEEALRQIDEAGLEDFSVRTLATRLGVYPTAIYWYVPSRNELLAGVVSLIHRKIVPEQRRKSWEQHLRELFENFRAAVRAHPNAAPLIGTQMVANTSMGFEFVESLLETLLRAGLTETRLVAAYNSVVAGLVGFAAQEFAPIPREDPKSWQLAVQRRLLTVNPERYPALAANLPRLSNQAFILRWESGSDAPLETSFEVFVDIMIAGIKSLTVA